MSREYFVAIVDVNNDDVEGQIPYVGACYNEPGLSWRDAKKKLRQWYLDQARLVRAMRETDIKVS